jgi:3-oxoacyl-[acyl-carrier protein] reductase
MSSARKGRVVLVTGTRTGIGRYLAEHFLGQGLAVVGLSRGPCDLQGESYRHFTVDVTREAELKRLFVEVRREHGRLDILVNNAGALCAAPAVLTSGAAVQGVLETNLFATVICCREAAILMKKGGFGRIVNLTSVAVPLAPEGSSVYGASKAAVEQFTRVFAKEVAPFGVTVNALGLPPTEDTGMAAALSAEATAETLRLTAMKRMITLAEVAHAVDFLVAEETGAITGQTLYLGGP